MKRLVRSIWLTAALICAAGAAHGQGVYSNSAFESTMDEMSKNFRLVVSSLIAEDWAKAQTSAAALGATAPKIKSLTPKANADRIGEFHTFADTVNQRITELGTAIKAKDREKSAMALGSTLATCMSCHAIFRK